MQFASPYSGGKFWQVFVWNSICTTPKKNILECKSKLVEKGWTITDRFDFEPLGMINTIRFHTKNIVAKKYYKVCN